jgi:hypothetical protein
MKLYKIILTDKREEFVPADSYSEVDGRFVFFRNGSPIPDVFFESSAVYGITVASDDWERDYGPRDGINLE